MDDSRALRTALGSFATGVTIVTTCLGSTIVPIIVNSFTAVSLKPPLVLWCIDARSGRYAVFRHAPSYVVSVLGEEHSELCGLVLSRAPPEVLLHHLEPTLVGPPAVKDAAAVFECRAHAAEDQGDHSILIGRVVAFR
jgi:4-hydroxyphenylacetate 3-hydroxylase, reductase component